MSNVFTREELERALGQARCLVCRVDFEEDGDAQPKVLPCGDTFCWRCVGDTRECDTCHQAYPLKAAITNNALVDTIKQLRVMLLTAPRQQDVYQEDQPQETRIFTPNTDEVGSQRNSVHSAPRSERAEVPSRFPSRNASVASFQQRTPSLHQSCSSPRLSGTRQSSIDRPRDEDYRERSTSSGLGARYRDYDNSPVERYDRREFSDVDYSNYERPEHPRYEPEEVYEPRRPSWQDEREEWNNRDYDQHQQPLYDERENEPVDERTLTRERRVDHLERNDSDSPSADTGYNTKSLSDERSHQGSSSQDYWGRGTPEKFEKILWIPHGHVSVLLHNKGEFIRKLKKSFQVYAFCKGEAERRGYCNYHNMTISGFNADKVARACAEVVKEIELRRGDSKTVSDQERYNFFRYGTPPKSLQDNEQPWWMDE